MIRYTTPTLTLIVEGIDLTGTDIYVTIEQGTHALTKRGSDLTVSVDQGNTTITLSPTQQESGAFSDKLGAYVQVNWITSNGTRAATEYAPIEIKRNLLGEVISYGN